MGEVDNVYEDIARKGNKDYEVPKIVQKHGHARKLQVEKRWENAVCKEKSQRIN